MATFAYRAVTRSGEAVEGEVAALDAQGALQEVLALGHIPAETWPVRGSARGMPNASAQHNEGAKGDGGALAWLSDAFRRLGNQNAALAAITQHLAALIKAGVPLVTALPVAGATSTAPQLSSALDEVQEALRRGVSLTDALAAHPAQFDALYVGIVRAGDRSGALVDALSALSRYLERSVKLRNSVITAMIYPALILTISVIAVAVLMVYVLPEFRGLLEGGGPLPWHTTALFAVSDWLRSDGAWLLLLLIPLGFGVRALFVSPAGRALRDRVVLATPVLRGLAIKLDLSRFCFALATCEKGGLPLLDGVHLACQSLANAPIRDSLVPTLDGMRQGEALSAGLRQSPYVPANMVNALAVGEETGQLGAIFGYLADQFETEIDQALRRVLALIEPLLILMMGLVVGMIIASVLTAIFEAQGGIL